MAAETEGDEGVKGTNDSEVNSDSYMPIDYLKQNTLNNLKQLEDMLEFLESQQAMDEDPPTS